MRIVLAGGSGFIGVKLIEKLLQANHHITVLTRQRGNAAKNFRNVHFVVWDAKTASGLTGILEGVDAVINLTGESIAARRWTKKQKERILSSRIESTRAIVSAICLLNRKPSVFINASASGYYGNVPDRAVTEAHPQGKGFLADVCKYWEAEALQAQPLGVRVVLLRSGIVLDKNGGVLAKLLPLFRLFLGGPLGTGKQWFPWIHIEDEVQAILFAIMNERITGPINLSSPESVHMVELCKLVGKTLRRPSWLRVPAWVLKLILGEMAQSLVVEGQKMVPEKLLEAGFQFQFQNLENALRDIVNQRSGTRT